MKPIGGQENGISECIDLSHDTWNVLEMRENEKRLRSEAWRSAGI